MDAFIGKVDFETHVEGTGAELFIREFHDLILSIVIPKYLIYKEYIPVLYFFL